VTDDWRSVLRHEFTAGDGSFLIRLRIDLVWDTEAFARLTRAMEDCCAATAGADQLERWLAEGFWYVYFFTQGHTDHVSWANSPQRREIDAGVEELGELADRFFVPR
jgi:hypothetical protein